MGFREKIENNLINPSIQEGDELIGYFNCVLRKDSLKIQLLGYWALFAKETSSSEKSSSNSIMDKKCREFIESKK